MSKLALTLLILGFLVGGCGANNDNQNSDGDVLGERIVQADPDSTQMPLSGGSENAANEEITTDKLSCPKGGLFANHDSPEKAAMSAACESADLDGLAIEFTDLIVESKLARNAEIRVVGWVEVCDNICPLEMEATYTLFKNSSGYWEANPAFARFLESEASKQKKINSQIDQLFSVTAVFSSKTAVIEYSGFFLDVEVIGNVELKNSEELFVQVKALDKNGEVGIFSARVGKDLERIFIKTEGPYMDNSMVTLQQYRFALYRSKFDIVYADWKTLN